MGHSVQMIVHVAAVHLSLIHRRAVVHGPYPLAETAGLSAASSAEAHPGDAADTGRTTDPDISLRLTRCNQRIKYLDLRRTLQHGAG